MGVGWSVADELAAVQAEVLYEIYRVLLLANGVKKHRVPGPLRIPRPHEASTRGDGQAAAGSRRRHASSVGEVIAVLKAGHRTGR